MGKLAGPIPSIEVLLAIVILGLQVACVPHANDIDESPEATQAGGQSTPDPTASLGRTSIPTSRVIPTLQAMPDGQLLQNTSFESGTESWESRIGGFIQTTEDSFTGVGSGQLRTSSVDARGDYSALAGQCVPLTGESTRLEVTAHINTSLGGTFVNIAGVFTDDQQCRGAHVGTFSIAVPAGEGWLVVTDVIDVPDGAASLDFLLSCTGAGPDDSILVDDVYLSPPALP